MILLRRFPDEHHCQSILINLSEKSAVMGSFWKSISVGDCQTYFRFLSQTFVFSESGSLPLHTWVKESHFGKTCICREIKILIVVKVFSVSCLCFKEIFSVHYGKCILPTYPEWNIRQTWKLNILWASSKTKPFQMHGTEKFVLDICWEAFLQFCFKDDILCFWFIWMDKNM